MMKTRIAGDCPLKPAPSEKAVPSLNQTKLWASEIGRCPRAALLRCRGYPETHPIPPNVLVAMRAGTTLEQCTVQKMRQLYPDMIAQLSLRNDLWSGKVDAAVGHRTQDSVLYEHKGVGDKWWNWNDNLPKLDHIMQLALYGQLYQELFDVKPRLELMYRSWQTRELPTCISSYHEADFSVQVADDSLEIVGHVDGCVVKRTFPINVAAVRQQFEDYYQQTDLPPLSQDVENQCRFRGQPGCRFFGHCW